MEESFYELLRDTTRLKEVFVTAALNGWRRLQGRKRSNYAQQSVLLLDRNVNRSYKRRAMMRAARFVIIAVAIFSIAYVLISPDLTDDVNGVLRSNHPAKAQRLVAVSLQHSQISVIVLFRLFTPPICTRRLASSQLLDLVCVCRC